MPYYYTITPATAGNLTTNGTANTETEAFFIKPGTRNAILQSVDVLGKAAGLVSISGIVLRLLNWGTASTAGTTITPSKKDPGSQAAKSTAASRPTSGTTRTNGPIFGCSAGGPGGYKPPIDDMRLAIEGSAAGSISMMDVSGTVSLTYEFTADLQE